MVLAGGDFDDKYEYESNQLDAERLVRTLQESHWTKVHIDENCIVGWATSYYNHVPTARKEDFIGDDTGKHKTIGEIRKPSIFDDYIYPYTGVSNVKFQYLMDKLNDTLEKKNLGAFYTPEPYAEKSHELLRKAIERVPAGNDYVIIDRCAGTGNLEKGLTDEELSHCILSTVEYYEYKVMQELLGSKVRHIIPPIEENDTFQAGLVKGSDALSKSFLDNPIIKQYVDNPQCTIILFENPPYAETTSIEHQKRHAGKKSSTWKDSYVLGEMRKDVKGTATNDLGNAFIWSGFHYYLRKPTDSYLVYSPAKYWKAHHLIDKRFLGGFAFNRRQFHTKINACIMCVLWSNEPADLECINLVPFDIDPQTQKLVGSSDKLPVKRVHKQFSSVYYDKRTFNDDVPGITSEFDGTESKRATLRIKPIFNENILGYLAVKGFNFDNPDSSVHLLRVGEYDANGFYIRRDNYLSKLPMFAASSSDTWSRAC